ncbi:uncharacterized protein BJ171DRAFT_197065 [Polychytrium aggregatum]|uniref:uncharacterized protein n=1 Tax=Polychytrium aggregatum TaxID=110093 RepID=UPI0022FEE416|nr:uncharacterized protein BJ171DRAFT_197065 [Polychytrium aggregatum]KAI9201881.1 hypothetical protein BJ171DRAFT_197065 [Polychytrium aggregatum]
MSFNPKPLVRNRIASTDNLRILTTSIYHNFTERFGSPSSPNPRRRNSPAFLAQQQQTRLRDLEGLCSQAESFLDLLIGVIEPLSPSSPLTPERDTDTIRRTIQDERLFIEKCRGSRIVLSLQAFDELCGVIDQKIANIQSQVQNLKLAYAQHSRCPVLQPRRLSPSTTGSLCSIDPPDDAPPELERSASQPALSCPRRLAPRPSTPRLIPPIQVRCASVTPAIGHIHIPEQTIKFIFDSTPQVLVPSEDCLAKSV